VVENSSVNRLLPRWWSPDLKLAIAGGYGVASRVHAVSRYDRQVLEYPALHEGVRG